MSQPIRTDQVGALARKQSIFLGIFCIIASSAAWVLIFIYKEHYYHCILSTNAAGNNPTKEEDQHILVELLRPEPRTEDELKDDGVSSSESLSVTTPLERSESLHWDSPAPGMDSEDSWGKTTRLPEEATPHQGHSSVRSIWLPRFY